MARKSGEPYFNHLEEVAEIVHHTGASDEAVAAAWLHDTVEDVGVTPGPRAAGALLGLAGAILRVPGLRDAAERTPLRGLLELHRLHDAFVRFDGMLTWSEDERNLADAIARGLRRHGMAVDVSYNGSEGHELAMVTRYDVVGTSRSSRCIT